MQCARCHYENLPQARFCGTCGEGLEPSAICSLCGAANPSPHNFCHDCGRPLVVEVWPPGHTSPPVPADEFARAQGMLSWLAEAEERRHITAMFCDLVGSTTLAEGRDPEDFHGVVKSYQEACAAVIARYGGQIGHYLGDGLVVYFGYPHAHEDDAERAAHAGLDIVEEVRRLSTLLRSRGTPIAIRIGIHSGLIVVGDTGGAPRSEKQLLGHTMNVAARLQGIAAPDSVVISSATLRLVQGLFITEELPPHELSGVSEQVTAYRLLRRSGMRSRLDVARATGLTPLVGREQELGLLIDRWELVQEGNGQAVSLSGEAGIGKSRLVLAFRERVAESSHTWLEFRCSPYSQDSALFPVIELQRHDLGLDRESTPEAKFARLEREVERAGFSSSEVVPLLAALHSLPLPECYAPPRLSYEAQKRKTLEALVEWLMQVARGQSLVIFIEDLQWVDPSTLEFLGLVLDELATTRLLAIFTYRPEFRAPWPVRSHVTPMMLSRLSRAQAHRMVEGAAGLHQQALPESLVREIVRKTDGVPLFVEEVTKTVLESHLLDRRYTEATAKDASWGPALPATLQDSLMARLDQLGSAKELAQLCAPLGREFPLALLRAVSPLDDAQLQPRLARLMHAEILCVRSRSTGPSYFFRHALIHEQAYQSLSNAARQRAHARVAAVLTERFPEWAEAQPELIAHHFAAAGMVSSAIGYWQQAGQRALERSANLEAIRHFTRGLEGLDTLPKTPAREEQELGLRTLLGVALMATKGYAAQEVERTFARARELCQELGATPQLFPVLYGLWVFYLIRADRANALGLAMQLRTFAKSSGVPMFLVEAHGAEAALAFWRGAHRQTVAHLAQASDIQNHHGEEIPDVLPGLDREAYAASYASLSLWFLGYPDKALESFRKALRRAETTGYPLTLAGVVGFGADLHHHRGEPGEFNELVERTIAIATDQALPMWVAAGLTIQGWASVERGELQKGIGQIQEGLSHFRATGALINNAYLLSLLVRAYLKAGMRAEGLATADEALALTERNLDCYYEAELHRLKGELLLAAPGADAVGAEGCFQRALVVARAQDAKSLELRAALSLSRLHAARGKGMEAFSLLDGVYRWFTEGFDTQDLKDAAAFLAELSPTTSARSATRPVTRLHARKPRI